MLNTEKLTNIYNRWLKVLGLVEKGTGGNELVETCRGEYGDVSNVHQLNLCDDSDNSDTDYSSVGYDGSFMDETDTESEEEEDADDDTVDSEEDEFEIIGIHGEEEVFEIIDQIPDELNYVSDSDHDSCGEEESGNNDNVVDDEDTVSYYVDDTS